MDALLDFIFTQGVWYMSIGEKYTNKNVVHASLRVLGKLLSFYM